MNQVQRSGNSVFFFFNCFFYFFFLFFEITLGGCYKYDRNGQAHAYPGSTGKEIEEQFNVFEHRRVKKRIDKFDVD